MEDGALRATGIVRRIDDLGRIVIPKEIRRTLRIRETDPLEIFTDKDGGIVLKKYSPIGELAEFAKNYADSLAQTTGNIVCVSDRDQIIAASGAAKKDLIEKPISRKLELAIEARETTVADRSDNKYITISDELEDEFKAQAISPIICEGDVLGAVIMLSRDNKQKFSETEEKLAKVAADFLGRQMES